MTITAQVAPRASRRYRVTGTRVLRSEWAKFWSLRSSWITLAVSLLLLVGVGVLAAATYDPAGIPARAPGGPRDAVSLALSGMMFAALAVGVLGVLVSAGEYSTGMIRSTLAAVPKRLPVLWSKSAVYGVLAAVVTAVGALAAFLLGGLVLNDQQMAPQMALSLGDPGVLRSLLGTGLYLGLVGVLGVALGALLRSTAGGIAVLTGVLLVLPLVTSLLPGSWTESITPYLPSNAGTAVTELQQSAGALEPWTGIAVFAGYVAVTLGVAAYRLVRADV